MELDVTRSYCLLNVTSTILGVIDLAYSSLSSSNASSTGRVLYKKSPSGTLGSKVTKILTTKTPSTLSTLLWWLTYRRLIFGILSSRSVGFGGTLKLTPRLLLGFGGESFLWWEPKGDFESCANLNAFRSDFMWYELASMARWISGFKPIWNLDNVWQGSFLTSHRRVRSSNLVMWSWTDMLSRCRLFSWFRRSLYVMGGRYFSSSFSYISSQSL